MTYRQGKDADRGRWPVALTVAGSDSGGGAGIQADLKTFSAMKVYGMSVITAVTAQNTQRVYGAVPLPVDMVTAQLDAVLDDIGADAVKTGMLMTAEIINTVADGLSSHGVSRLVVDPVMIATRGDRLLDDDAVRPIVERLLPLALVATPNIPEAEALSGVKIDSQKGMLSAARAIRRMGARNVVVKGAHLGARPESCDLLLTEAGENILLCTEYVDTTSTHGTGCTFAAAFAAALALGCDVTGAFERAKSFISEALRSARPLGKGNGPVDHLWPFR
jgi:hydroxymethylpyrimidine kinase/phosphomethylpyrimidine kinase